MTRAIGKPQGPGYAVLTAAVAVGFGVATTRVPLLAVAGAVALSILTFGLALPGRLSRAFLLVLGLVLFGYATWGRAFAYLGVAPVFVGEAVLALGLLAMVDGGRNWSILKSPVMLAMVAFALWGSSRTFPYTKAYGVDALRDAVIWGYSAFAFSIALLAPPHLGERVAERYASLLRWFLVWAPIGLVLSRAVSDRVPTVPGSNVPLFALKPGDVGVHLAGAAAFLLLDLHRVVLPNSSRRPVAPSWSYWVPWCCGLLIVASLSRGGLLAVIAAVATVTLVRPLEGAKKLARVGIGAAFVVAALVAFEVNVDVGDSRKVSPQQVVTNLASISHERSAEALEGSRRWRLLWWNTILDYTVFGRYFWTGKGFGVNLADADGFQVYGDRSLRSPHNGHLTILARAGVPGLVLWLLVLISFAGGLVRAALRAMREGHEWWARVDLWILGYWAAFIVNGAFDVFLEGPQGGIWFWSLVGFGLSVLHAQSRHPDSIVQRRRLAGEQL